MLVSADIIKSLPVVSMQDGQMIARIYDIILDRDSLGLIALMCVTRKKHFIILGRDVRYIAKDCVLVDDENGLSNPEDLARFELIINRHYDPTGKTVITDNGLKLGKVNNYDINLDDGSVQRIHVKQNILRSWRRADLIIDRTQITDLKPESISVNDARIFKPTESNEASAINQSPAKA